jgi:RNA polymerase sigma-70 factor (ECF subfamily)
MSQAGETLERVFREEYGRIIATLIRISGSFALYEELLRFTASPIVALNHAAAVAMSEGFERGLGLIEAADEDGALQNYYLFHASRADLLRRLHRYDEATAAYETALSLTTNRVEQNYIRHRVEELGRNFS